MKLFIALAFSFFLVNANAEYRVYQYLIHNTVLENPEEEPRLITSTLDPVSYQAYNGGSSLIRIDLLRTWICPGHTGKKDYCKSPYDKMMEANTL